MGYEWLKIEYFIFSDIIIYSIIDFILIVKLLIFMEFVGNLKIHKSVHNAGKNNYYITQERENGWHKCLLGYINISTDKLYNISISTHY